jgi:hypothetical protein
VSETDWASRMAALDARLRPIAESPPPVDITDPDWERKMRSLAPAVDRAGVRAECEALLAELVIAYDGGDDATREKIRGLFRDNPSFAWAASLPIDGATPDGFRAELLHFSMLDQGRDPRDAKVWLDGLVAAARAAGAPTREVLEDVAGRSNRRPVYDRWPSTEDMLLNAR